ncbi:MULTISPECIES: hypothetical protein [Streptomycetaceae]|uniref:Flp family type IVb pilin n=1 Tax=Streptantibioticus cattleyicolor (strain ATCC 35852 / DSM 46488 / JCM 4925 / NBRC 14057 / NRRL 8057) TaxID=1003195 RepID=F8K2F0_STREN|nr:MULTISPECIES: hypothetical protein [Streptomycetaceae]AEW96242.1 hypothetical protein SCATT_38710 [Streptantibioticus cattleyicolor NRRL 8057 = DSM 46488]MYS60762.1 hypothetical protein [Streptomyces sp. SID5468]CCB76581.1 protein of unknown function [Streptantibioticus cattleyicolor NRRL 8057 = DSM 46488]
MPKRFAGQAATTGHGRPRAAVRRLAARAARHDRGQTSVEYLGIIAVVVLIVAAIAGTGIGHQIYSAIVAEIAKVTG